MNPLIAFIVTVLALLSALVIIQYWLPRRPR
jgi:hypothetical protein